MRQLTSDEISRLHEIQSTASEERRSEKKRHHSALESLEEGRRRALQNAGLPTDISQDADEWTGVHFHLDVEGFRRWYLSKPRHNNVLFDNTVVIGQEGSTDSDGNPAVYCIDPEQSVCGVVPLRFLKRVGEV